MSLEMIIASSSLAYLALLLWLGIRIFNRRERWAKWSLATVGGLPLAYLVSFGPACWIASRTKSETLPRIYLPVLYGGFFAENETLLNLSCWYAGIGMPRTSAVNFPLIEKSDETGYFISNSDAATGELSIYTVEGRWSVLRQLCEWRGTPIRVVSASVVGGTPGAR